MTTSNSEPSQSGIVAALKGQSVLVLGGRGFVGSHVVRALVAAGARPHVFGPRADQAGLADLAGSFDEHEGSTVSRDDVLRALEKSRARLVVSCAAFGEGRLGLMRSGEVASDPVMDVNVVGFGRLLDCARESGVQRVVWAGSTVVYGPARLYPDGPVDEDAAVAPETFYGLSKVLAEEIAAYHARRYGLSVVGLRLPLLLGPGLWYQGAAASLAGLFEAARKGEGMRIAFHDAVVDLMHVDDAAQSFLVALAHEGKLGVAYNLEGFKTKASDIVGMLRRMRPGLAFDHEAVEPPMVFPLITGARFQRDTGFRARHDLEGFVKAMLAGGSAA